MSPRPRKGEQTTDLQERILEAAWEQIAHEGAAALSLRAVARRLNITAPAIYNYYPDRDALVTALIVAAYTSLGQAQQQALDEMEEAPLAQRLHRLGRVYRAWAVQYPERYHLIFGTPIAGYHAPAEVTMPVAACALTPLIRAVDDLVKAGLLREGALPPLPGRLQEMLEQWRAASGDFRPEALLLALTLWSFVHGLVSLEISQQFPPPISEPGLVFEMAVDQYLRQLFKP
jgi:AcrR family transcriptional regulator